jgi:hypothetical protein
LTLQDKQQVDEPLCYCKHHKSSHKDEPEKNSEKIRRCEKHDIELTNFFCSKCWEERGSLCQT